MTPNDRKAKTDQHGKSSEGIIHDGKHGWHRPAVRRLETASWTHLQGKNGDDGKDQGSGGDV